MRGPIDDGIRRLADDIAVARRKAAAAQAELATACVEYADARIAADRTSEAAESARARAGRAGPGEFVADEVSLLLREQPFPCLLYTSPSPRDRS